MLVMKSTSSSSSGSSRDDKRKTPPPPRLIVSECDEVKKSTSSLFVGNSTLSRKSSRNSLKSTCSSDVNNTKDEIIAAMIKERMKEFEEFEEDAEAGPSFMAKPSPSVTLTSMTVTPNKSTPDQKMLKINGSSKKSSPTIQHQESINSMTSEEPVGTRSSSVSITGKQETIRVDPLDLLESRVAGDAAISRDEKSKRKYSRSHQRRFHRRFPTIGSDEMLIDWFNCALIADILLQGYIYISDNYFAFYSNIFGYKTQILIPVSDVVSVTKEKTAKIFPNAVGICTDEAKYVFGSLISRESTFRLMQEVWRSNLSEVASTSCLDRIKHMKEVRKERIANEETLNVIGGKLVSSASEGLVSDEDDDSTDESPTHSNNGDRDQPTPGLSTPFPRFMHGQKMWVAFKSWASRTSQSEKRRRKWVLAAITLALILLFLSAMILIFRANRVYSRLTQLTGEDIILQSFSYPSPSSQKDGIEFTREDSDALRLQAAGHALLVTNHIKKIARSLQFKLGEVAHLKQELDTLFKQEYSSS